MDHPVWRLQSFPSSSSSGDLSLRPPLPPPPRTTLFLHATSKSSTCTTPSRPTSDPYGGPNSPTSQHRSRGSLRFVPSRLVGMISSAVTADLVRCCLRLGPPESGGQRADLPRHAAVFPCMAEEARAGASRRGRLGEGLAVGHRRRGSLHSFRARPRSTVLLKTTLTSLIVDIPAAAVRPSRLCTS